MRVTSLSLSQKTVVLQCLADNQRTLVSRVARPSIDRSDETKRLNVYARLDFLNSRNQLSYEFN